MRILILSAKDDNGGIGIAIKRAFDKYAPEHEVRSVTREDNFIGWEKDIFWRYNDAATGQYVSTLFDQADVIHIMDVFRAADWHASYSRKPKVFHHHGVDFKSNATAIMERCRAEGAKQIVATHDLLRYGDGLTWFPNPCDVDRMQEFRTATAPERGSRMRPLVVQTPSGRDKNGTDPFLDGLRQLDPDSYDVDLIEGLPWRSCMARKARADLMFDSFDVGYGISTLEAWGMGIPVIHGGDALTEQAVLDTIGFTPYYHATRDNIGERLTDMVSDHHLRRYWADQGWQAVNDFHAEQVAVKNLVSYYEEAIG